MALDSSLLRELARDLGVGTDHRGWDGTRQEVADDTLTDVLAALGAEVTSDQDITRIRDERERETWIRTLPPVTVLRQDRETTVPVHVDHGTAVRARLHLEDGDTRPLQQVEDLTPPVDLDGRLRGRARFHLPSHLPLGWHRILAELGTDETAEADVVVTPARVTVADSLGRARAFGLQAQLYSVRSPRSWGIGDLADLRDLAAITGARHGADFLLINPLHASSPTAPMEPSPYLPVTRRFTSALYLRIEDVPEHRQLSGPTRRQLALLRQRVEGWNSRTDHLERDAVLSAKLEALEELFAVDRTPARQALLEAYREREGQGLEDFALWSAIAERNRGTEDDVLRHLDERTVARARTELADRIAFHAWVQWLLDEQLAAAQAAARDAGMRLGVMHDLAVGVEQVGADAWSLRDVLATGVTVGAPADQYNQQGQNWHQPPWHPEGLRRASYRPWRDMLRTLMRHAGALRIDHVLGLFRLWWIPQGRSAAEGAYVSYDHEAMVGILTLEAERSGTLVIGEDLGTFEPWVRDHLSERGILGTSILWFERDEAGRPLPPERYRGLCLASVNTHDLPPTAGYLAGDHVSLRHDLGLLERGLDEELAADAASREEVLDLLRAEGLLAEDADIEQTVIALHRHLTRTPSLLLGVSLVDCVGERRIQNQPGTDEEYPNWRIPLADAEQRPVTVDDLASDARTARLLTAVREGLRPQ